MKPIDLTKQELENLLRLLGSKDIAMLDLGGTLLKQVEFTEELIHKINIGNLLTHQHGTLVKLALTWVETFDWGLKFLTEIFVLYKCTGNKKIKRKAKRLLQKYASPELKVKLAFKYLLIRANIRSTNPSDFTIKQNIIRYTEDCELDGTHLAYLLYQKYGTGGNYLLTTAPKEVRKKFLRTLINGTSLKITGKKLSEFPVDLFEFSELTEVDLSNNNILSIPDDIQQLQKLKILRLDRNSIYHLNPKLSQLKELETLSIGYNSLKRYPEVLSKLTTLKKLNIEQLSKGHFYIYIPEAFQALTQLEELRMSSGRIRISCYTQDNKYPYLTVVHGTPIDLCPLALAQAAYRQNKQEEGIVYLFQHGTDEMIYPILEDYYDLKTASLDLGNVFLVNLPKAVTKFSIKHLNLENTFRYETDKEIGLEYIEYLSGLESLNLNRNKLKTLPENFKNLSTLKKLDLDYNAFIEIPIVIFELKNLVELSIKGNAFVFSDYYKIHEKLEISERFAQLKRLKYLKFNIPGRREEALILEYKASFRQLLPNCMVTFE